MLGARLPKPPEHGPDGRGDLPAGPSRACGEWRQFVLLLIVNACVGGMVGLERTVVPLIGSETFHLASATLITSFIVSFGVAKALTNLVSGSLAGPVRPEARAAGGLADSACPCR